MDSYSSIPALECISSLPQELELLASCHYLAPGVRLQDDLPRTHEVEAEKQRHAQLVIIQHMDTHAHMCVLEGEE